MKLGGIIEDNLLIELDEEELSIIIEGLEVVGNLRMISDMDTIVFDYHRELEKMENQ